MYKGGKGTEPRRRLQDNLTCLMKSTGDPFPVGEIKNGVELAEDVSSILTPSVVQCSQEELSIPDSAGITSTSGKVISSASLWVFDGWSTSRAILQTYLGYIYSDRPLWVAMLTRALPAFP
jgi:hypothetical protein